MHKKISIIGAGNVGSTTAGFIAMQGLGDVVLVDVDEGKAKGKALDIMHSMPIEEKDIIIQGTADFREIKNSDIVIIAAGLPRRPGMTREDLLKKNSEIVENISKEIKKYSPKAIMIVVTNPLDAMVYKAWKITEFPKERVIGMGNSLDTTRFKALIAQETKSSVKDVDAMVIGCHSCDLMVILKEHAKVKDKLLSKILKKDKIEQTVEKTRHAGDEIVGFLKEGSAYFAPAKAITAIVEAIVHDKKKIIPCSVLCESEYGAHNIFLGVPVVIGKNGAEKIVEIELSKEEKEEMKKSIEYVKVLVKQLS